MTTNQLKSAAAVRRTPCGVTLVEVMVSMVILAIVALGALGYQYHAAREGRIAKAQITATRTAQLLLEDWKSTGGSTNYNPTTLGLGFLTPPDAADEADYFITVDYLPMYIVLSYNDVGTDDSAGIILREVSVTVSWRRDHRVGSREINDPSLVLTTYVNVSGG